MKPACTRSASKAAVAVLLAALAPIAGRAEARRPVLVVVAPHPDDAEASCGGLMANAAAAGQEVVVLSMTAGEIGVPGRTEEEARVLRSAEARKAAALLGARVEFFGAVDGSLVADAGSAERLTAALLRLEAATVLAPWPLDVHPDHQAAGQLAWRAFQDRRLAFDLYFYETTNAPHTTSFRFAPTDYVDITGVARRKQEATLQHASQNPSEWFGMYLALARVRGYEADVDLAEGYIRARNASGLGGRAPQIPRTLGGASLAMRGPRDEPPEPAPLAPPRDWAGTDRYRAANARAGAPRPGEPRVVFFGDSITEHWAATVPAFFDGRILGRGISGQTTAQMLARFHEDVLDLAPRAVVILAGTNDIAGNTGPYRQEETFSRLRAMVELAQARGVRVVLASLLPARAFDWAPGVAPAAEIVALNARLRAYAEKRGVVWLDYHSAMADEAGGLRPGLGDDGVHPNRAGFAVMAPLAEAALQKALAAK